MKFLFEALFLIFTLIMSLSNAQGQHPNGQPISLKFDELSNTNFAKIKEIFGHPEVKDRKVVILSIAGAYRKGKSFFLNYCLRFLYANYQTVNTLIKNENWWGRDDEPLLGFSWKHGDQLDTKGILFWSDVFLHEQNGEKLAIFLMDSQGIFGSDGDNSLDAKIFGITNFISSVQILNIGDFIQDSQLKNLKLVTDFAKLTKIRQTEKSLFSTFKPFQNFLILFRDWSDDNFGYRYGNGYDGGEIYVKRVLDIRGNTDEVIQDVQSHINDSYDNFNTFLLSSPGEVISGEAYDGRWGPLDNEFKEQVKILIESILLSKNLVKKRVFGKEITTKDLSNYIISVFTAFKRSNLTESVSIFNSIVENELTELSLPQVDEYLKKLKQITDHTSPNYATKLLEDHRRIEMETVANFKKLPNMADPSSENKYIEILKSRIEAAYITWKISVDALNKQHIAYKQQQWQLLQQRRHQAAESYKNTAAYRSCRFFTFGAHDCGLSNIVNSVT